MVVEPKWKVLVKGVVLGTLYCFAYLWLWQHSFNQWYLPAGIRVTGILLLPARFVPFLMLGDAMALLMLRVPKIGKYSALWAYGTPFLIILLVTAFAWCLRTWQSDRKTLARWLPLNAAVLALWASAWLMIMNAYMGGPKPLVTAHNYFSYSVGDYLGIMMVALSVLLAIEWRERRGFDARLARNLFISGAIVVALCVVAITMTDDSSVVILLLLLMALPATFLAIMHGWDGAAIGIVMMNVAVALALPEEDAPGQFDGNVFIVQQVLCVLSAMLLLLGGRITDHFERAKRAGIEEKEARSLAKRGFWLNEWNFRGQSNQIAFTQLRSNESLNALAEELKDEKQFSAALAVKGSSAVLKRLLNSQAEALYPRLIGSGGLLAVIHSDAFKDWWIGDADLTISFKGQPREFSEPMQHNAYRSICCAVAALSECAPSEYVIYLRTWHLRKGASLGMIIRTMPTTKVAPTEVSRNAFTELTVRTKVHGGIVRRRHANQISVWLPVCSETD